MPEPVQQPTPQPQVTTTPKSHDWKKVGLTVLVILVVTGLITGAYWFLVLGKSSADSDLTGPVPKVTTKTSTESAKESTSSAEKDETADWGTYTDNRLKFQIKYPSAWTASFEDSKSVSPEEPNKIYRIITLKKGDESIRFLEGGGLGFDSAFENKTFNIGDEKVNLRFYSYSDTQSAYMSYDNLDIPGSTEVLGFWIIVDKNTADKTITEIKKILSTFKFLD